MVQQQTAEEWRLASLRERGWSPEEVYRSGLGIPQAGEYLNPWERYQAKVYEPRSFLYGIRSRMAGVEGTEGWGPGPYRDVYAAQMAEGGRYGAAQQILGRLKGATGTQREAGFVGPEDYAGLLQMALRPQIGVVGGEVAASRVPALQERYQREVTQFGASPPASMATFLDYLWSKFDLGQYGWGG